MLLFDPQIWEGWLFFMNYPLFFLTSYKLSRDNQCSVIQSLECFFFFWLIDYIYIYMHTHTENWAGGAQQTIYPQLA